MSWTKDKLMVRDIGIMARGRIVWTGVVIMMLVLSMSVYAAQAFKTVSVAEGLGAGAAAQADTYYVSTKGSDENPGSEAKPWRTVQKSANRARAGDTILVHGGVYREAVILRFSGQRGKPIVLTNYPGEQPVIQPGERGKQPPGHSLLLQAQEGYQKPIGWIMIEGLEFRYGHDGIKFYNAHDIIIRKCHIQENWNQGILGNGNRVLIDRNIIAGNGTNKKVARNLVHGIYATGSAFTITNNLIYSNTAYGVQVAAYDYKKDSMAGPEYAEAKNWLIANNTFAFNKNRAGMVIWQDGVENCVVQNNIFFKNGGVNGILFYTQKDRRHLIRNNIFYPPGENLVSSEENAYQAIDNQQIDPRFVEVESFDFHLKADSPAIDRGSDDRAPKTDFEGKPRSQGKKVDVGAYEHIPARGQIPPAIKAFPSAEGFGANTMGGRGGRVITVTNLNDNGPGSLREALSTRGPRIIRFAVEGAIELKSPLVVTEGRVTLDGDTAPGQGVTLLHHGIHFRGNCKDIIVRHLRIRVTTGGNSGDCLLFWGVNGGKVERVLVEHCSLMGATDEIVNTWGRVRDVTVQWTIIAKGRPPHSMGWLSGTGSDRITIHHCLFAQNADRSPRLAGGLYDVVNNVIYNWSHHNAAKIGGGARVNFVHNAYIPGPQSTTTEGCILPEDPNQGTKLYLAGNITPLTPKGTEYQWLSVTYWQRTKDKWIEHYPAPEKFRAAKPFPVAAVTTQPAKKAYDLVLARAGARVRDTDDLRVIQEVESRTGGGQQ
jgi:pectate lyase